MKAPGFARIIGILFLAAGALGFVPWVTSPAPLSLTYINLAGHYGLLFGAFAVNDAHDFIHIFIGGWGILASFGFKSSVLYLRVVACLYLLLVVLGAIPITSTLFGAVPIYGWDVGLHLIVALVALYGGFGAGSLAEEAPAF
jgi:Domain of unknown function (DUF4383)